MSQGFTNTFSYNHSCNSKKQINHGCARVISLERKIDFPCLLNFGKNNPCLVKNLKRFEVGGKPTGTFACLMDALFNPFDKAIHVIKDNLIYIASWHDFLLVGGCHYSILPEEDQLVSWFFQRDTFRTPLPVFTLTAPMVDVQGLGRKNRQNNRWYQYLYFCNQ